MDQWAEGPEPSFTRIASNSGLKACAPAGPRAIEKVPGGSVGTIGTWPGAIPRPHSAQCGRSHAPAWTAHSAPCRQAALGSATWFVSVGSLYEPRVGPPDRAP